MIEIIRDKPKTLNRVGTKNYFMYIGFFLIVGLVMALFINDDSKQRGMNSTGWTVFAFFLPILALIFYLILRKPKIDPARVAPRNFTPPARTPGMGLNEYATMVKEEKAKQQQKVNSIVTSHSQSVTQKEVLAQLKDLAELKSQGVLTEEEFQQQKKKILG